MKPRPAVWWYRAWALCHCDGSRKSEECDSFLSTNCGADSRRVYSYGWRRLCSWTPSVTIRGSHSKRQRALVLSPSATSQTKGLVFLGWNWISLAAGARATLWLRSTLSLVWDGITYFEPITILMYPGISPVQSLVAR